MPENEWSVRTYVEARTACGQLVRIWCRQDEEGQVREFLAGKVYSATIEPERTTAVSHGVYSQHSRYDLRQHGYAGGGGPGCGGIIEVLEIGDPPAGRERFVIHESSSLYGTAWSEWRTLEDAIAAYGANWSGSAPENAERFNKLPGFIRTVRCGDLTPWFYAIGDQELVGDFALPYGLADDPVYRLGRRFAVYGRDGEVAVKTCLGTRFVSRGMSGSGFERKNFRRVHWDDGTFWEDGSDTGPYGIPRPEPADEGELWIVEAMREFRALLTGAKTSFSIRFTDGASFFGRIAGKRGGAKPDAEGKYFLRVSVKGEAKPREGWTDFKPTPECPSVIAFVTAKLAEKGQELERLQMMERDTRRGGKKWTGVFLSRGR